MSGKLFPALTECVYTLVLLHVTSCEAINRPLCAKLEGVPIWSGVKETNVVVLRLDQAKRSDHYSWVQFTENVFFHSTLLLFHCFSM